MDYKSPGLHGIFPTTLRRGGDRVVEFLSNRFEAWHLYPKDYRPISLASLLLKTLECLTDVHIKLILDEGLLAKAQHMHNVMWMVVSFRYLPRHICDVDAIRVNPVLNNWIHILVS